MLRRRASAVQHMSLLEWLQVGLSQTATSSVAIAGPRCKVKCESQTTSIRIQTLIRHDTVNHVTPAASIGPKSI